MDTDASAVASFEAQSAQIAADIAAKFAQPAVTPDAIVPAQVAAAVVPDPVAPTTQVTPAAGSPDDGVVGKLLTKLTDMEAQIAALKAAPAPEVPQPTGNQNLDSWDDFHDDPWTAMEKRGMDAPHIAKSILARVMGNDAPPELRAQAALGGRFSQMTKMITDLTGQVQSLTKEIGRRDYYTELNAYTPAETSTPATAAMLKVDPKWVQAQVKAVVSEDARARSTVPGAKPLTPDEVYARLEERIAPVYSAFAKPQTASAATSSVSPSPSQAAAPPPANAAQNIPLATNFGGAPPATPAPSTWEDKVNAIMKDVLSKHGLSQ